MKQLSPAISTLKPETRWGIEHHPSPPSAAHAIVLASWREGGPKSTEASDVRASVAWPAACGGHGQAPPQASQSRLRAGVSDPPMRLRGETNAVCIASGHNRRVQGCRQGPDTLHRSLAMELRPLGLPPWCVDQQLQPPSPGRNGRYGARDDAQHPQQRGPGTIHGADPRAPLPHSQGGATASRRAAPVRLRDRASFTGVILGLVPRIPVLDPKERHDEFH